MFGTVGSKREGQEQIHGSHRTSPKERLKIQIDAILQNEFSVLSRHPDAHHRSLLTTHNNPLILRYVKNIYE